MTLDHLVRAPGVFQTDEEIVEEADFWTVVHIWVGWLLLNWSRWTVPGALGASVAEVAIVVTKFVLFLSAPQWTIWRTNWFINKIFVLAVFVLLLGWLVAYRRGWWTAAREPSMPQ